MQQSQVFLGAHTCSKGTQGVSPRHEACGTVGTHGTDRRHWKVWVWGRFGVGSGKTTV